MGPLGREIAGAEMFRRPNTRLVAAVHCCAINVLRKRMFGIPPSRGYVQNHYLPGMPYQEIW